jgi:signal transduction histidine kinase
MYVGSSTNIHEQKTGTIALRISNEIKDEFLGVATDELRTPIISNKAELQSQERSALAGTELNKSLSLVALAKWQVAKLTEIVDDLVDVSRIQS